MATCDARPVADLSAGQVSSDIGVGRVAIDGLEMA